MQTIGWRYALITLALVLWAMVSPPTLFASERPGATEVAPPSTTPQASQQDARPDSATEDDQDDDDSDGKDLKSLGFGLGLGFRWNVLSPDLVNEAETDVNGIVRVKERANTHTGLTLETHYLVKKNAKGSFGFGPFVAVEAGSDTVISSVGLGVLAAWKVNDEGRGFGLGLGYSAQPQAKVLAPPFEEGKPAPKDPDGKPLAATLQTRDKGSIQLLFSVVF